MEKKKKKKEREKEWAYADCHNEVRAKSPRSFHFHLANRTPPSFVTLSTKADKLGQGLDQTGTSISTFRSFTGRRGTVPRTGWWSVTSILPAGYLENKKSWELSF